MFPLRGFEVGFVCWEVFVDLSSDNNVWVVHIDGKSEVITARLLKRDFYVPPEFRQDLLNRLLTPINLHSYYDHFHLSIGRVDPKILHTLLFFQIAIANLFTRPPSHLV